MKTKAKNKKPSVVWKNGTLWPVEYWVKNSKHVMRYSPARVPVIVFGAPSDGCS